MRGLKLMVNICANKDQIKFRNSRAARGAYRVMINARNVAIPEQRRM
jgi:hypothetical protein